MSKLNKGNKMQYIINIKSVTGEIEYTEIFENLNDANNQLELLKECKADKIITLTESKGNKMNTEEKFELYIKAKSQSQLNKLFPDYKYVNLKSLLTLPLYAKENILLYHGVK